MSAAHEHAPGVLYAYVETLVDAACTHPRVFLAMTTFVLYITACNALRFRRAKGMHRQHDHTYTDRASFASMTANDAQAILATIQQREFPFMHTLAIEFGIFKTYGIPAISRLVGATRQVTDPVLAAKRAADTLVILTEIMVNPPTSARSLQALARMNYLHSKYVNAGQIRNGDLLYTLSACFTEPIRFIERYEWRALTDVERCALGVFWKEVGENMGISYEDVEGHREWRDGLDFVDDVTAWARTYERNEMKPHPANIPPAHRFAALLLLLVPPFLRPFALEAISVLMSDRMREAFSFADPGLAAILLVYGTLAVRRFVERYLMLPRFGAHRVTSEHADPVTGRVHLSEYLAHPWYIEPNVWNRWGPIALLKHFTGGVVPGDLRGHKEEELKKGGPTYLPEGFLVSDLGPFNTMGVGKDETAAEVERLKTMRAAGCPFG
ncbi:hypothetical protein SEUCBS139899_002783 [Sporothrix eucalyptigena]